MNGAPAHDAHPAPGFWIGNVIVMAGVPSIMQAMLDEVAPKLKIGVRMCSRKRCARMRAKATSGCNSARSPRPSLRSRSHVWPARVMCIAGAQHHIRVRPVLRIEERIAPATPRPSFGPSDYEFGGREFESLRARHLVLICEPISPAVCPAKTARSSTSLVPLMRI
jgi:hypothetical protein